MSAPPAPVLLDPLAGVPRGDLPTDPALSPGPESVAVLEDPPRAVPALAHLGALGFSPKEVFLVLVVVVGPAALWTRAPWLLPPVAAVLLAVVVRRRWRRHRRVLHLLRHARVAQVTNGPSAVFSRRPVRVYQTTPVRQARGWQVTAGVYTGPGYLSLIEYDVDGRSGSLELRGPSYAGGVVLADPHEPDLATELTQLPLTVHPDAAGRLRVEVTGWQTIGAVTTVALLVALPVLALVVAIRTW